MSNFSFIPPDGAPQLEPTGDDGRFVLVKQGKRYVFECPPGGEPQLLQQLRQLVADPQVDFNWFDAAVISHEIGQRMSRQLDRLHQNRKPA